MSDYKSPPVFCFCFAFSLKKCIEYLKTARLGCREFLPLDTLQKRRLRGSLGEDRSASSFALGDFDDEEDDDGGGGEGRGVLMPPPPQDALPGGCRWAVDCVSFDDTFRPVYEVQTCVYFMYTCRYLYTLRRGLTSVCGLNRSAYNYTLCTYICLPILTRA